MVSLEVESEMKAARLMTAGRLDVCYNRLNGNGGY